AGFAPSKGNPSKYAKVPSIKARVEEIIAAVGEKIAERLGERINARAQSPPALPRISGIAPRTGEQMVLSRERLAWEAAVAAFSSMANYVRINANGDPEFDWSNVTPEGWAAVRSLTIETYMEGRGEGAREVKRVRFQLYDKNAALLNLANVMGWVAKTRPDSLD